MLRAAAAPEDTGWDAEAGEALIRDLWALREGMLAREARLRATLDEVAPAHRASAVNLVH